MDGRVACVSVKEEEKGEREKLEAINKKREINTSDEAACE